MSRITLRRSCASCAKAKLSCDLQKPQCKRCFEKKLDCVYANEPLTSTRSDHGPGNGARPLRTSSKSPNNSQLVPMRGNGARIAAERPDVEMLGMGDVDPFDTFPKTNLPRPMAQRFIHHCEFPTAVSLHQNHT